MLEADVFPVFLLGKQAHVSDDIMSSADMMTNKILMTFVVAMTNNVPDDIYNSSLASAAVRCIVISPMAPCCHLICKVIGRNVSIQKFAESVENINEKEFIGRSRRNLRRIPSKKRFLGGNILKYVKKHVDFKFRDLRQGIGWFRCSDIRRAVLPAFLNVGRLSMVALFGFESPMKRSFRQIFASEFETFLF